MSEYSCFFYFLLLLMSDFGIPFGMLGRTALSQNRGARPYS